MANSAPYCYLRGLRTNQDQHSVNGCSGRSSAPPIHDRTKVVNARRALQLAELRG